MDRRQFVISSAAASLATSGALQAAVAAAKPAPGGLRAFDYRGVTLLPGRLRDQFDYARGFYFSMSNDDMLRGFRRAAGLPAPGNDMKGWCRRDCSATFGQWLSGMARISCATKDQAMREKVIYLITEWERTLGPADNTQLKGWGTYSWEKMACGLVDAAVYLEYPDALRLFARITRWAMANFDRARSPARVTDRDGRRPKGTLEWYTLAENALRAYLLTKDPLFLEFANLWPYHDYWDPFITSARPAHAAHLHSYSHVNTFSSAAMLYSVTREQRYLQILRNAYDWATQTQAYASGGFGPGEWSVPADGSLGSALEVRLDTAELPCGSWAGFKLARYLAEFTGQARYGEWVETLLYNGIGAALPIQPDGRSFYYADYRLGMGLKTYFWDEWPCCSGTYAQAIADYCNIIYYHDADGLCVSQLVASKVNWMHRGQSVELVQETRYPEEDVSRLTVNTSRPVKMNLRFRIPAWCTTSHFKVNGELSSARTDASGWACIDRRWQPGDVVEVRYEMNSRFVAVDAQHPHRVALMHGPVLMAQDARFGYPLGGDAQQLLGRLKRKQGEFVVNVDGADANLESQGGQGIANFKPYYAYEERQPYRVYFDLDAPRFL